MDEASEHYYRTYEAASQVKEATFESYRRDFDTAVLAESIPAILELQDCLVNPGEWLVTDMSGLNSDERYWIFTYDLFVASWLKYSDAEIPAPIVEQHRLRLAKNDQHREKILKNLKSVWEYHLEHDAESSA